MTPDDNRQRILQFIRRSGEVSLRELRAGLGLSHVTIHRHLHELIRQGLISPPERRHLGRPGRPEMIYSVTAKVEGLLPTNYADLSRAVISALASKQGPEWLRRLMRESGSRAASAFGVSVSPVHSESIRQVLAGLESRGYLPAIGTWSGRRCLTFANCPYLDAARASPVLCAFDQGLLETLLGEPVVLFRRIVEHDPQCMFLLGV